MEKETFVAYIDESGDEGFSFVPGCSDWFVLSAVVVRRSDDLKLVELNNGVKHKLGMPIKKPLHFRKMKPWQKDLYVNRISESKLRTISILVYKPSINDPETFRERYRLYFYAVRLLCERISWYCRDRVTQHDSGNGKVQLIFSNRSGMSYQEMMHYLRVLHLQHMRGVDDIRIHWNAMHTDKTKAMTPGKRAGLQVADAIAGSFYNAVQVSPQGKLEDHYARTLKPVVYGHKGKRHHGYGLKFFPSNAKNLREIQSHLSWVINEYP